MKLVSNKVLVYMISRGGSVERDNILRNSLDELSKARCGLERGKDFNFILFIIGTNECSINLSYKYNCPVTTTTYNVGQHVITNTAISMAKEGGYKYLLRLDDDIKFLTVNWLRKLLEAADKLGDNFIISPRVVGLNHPPEQTNVVEQNGVKFRVLMEAIGGVCRLHPVSTICREDDPYISDIRHPLGAGDATGIGQWCQRNLVWMAWLENIRLKHSTNKQVEDDPTYHQQHDLFQTIPYIPPYKGEI